MTNSEIKEWAKGKIKGKLWTLLPVILVAGLLTSLSFTYTNGDGSKTVVSFGWLFYFVEVGLAYYMVKFITDQDAQFNDLFHFSNDFGRCLVTNLLQSIFVILWTFLLIIPGIMKAFAYSLVPYLLADEKYKDLGYREILKKSEEMMNGHKMNYFILNLSFIGWYLLSILTLGILLIWIIPYHQTAAVKFLNDVKESREK